MKRWGYEEKTLAERIDVHKKFSKYEINDWILKIVALKKGERVLDIGCGDGKQTIPYAKKVGKTGVVIGTDISGELLEEAGEKAKQEKVRVQLIKHDANTGFDFEDDYFDVISCCFAIYYLMDVEKFLLEVKRILKNGGRIFVVGPTVDNAKEMILIHSKITGKEVPQLREKRMRDEIIPLIKKHFDNVKINVFNNQVNFPTTKAFLSYYESTLLFKESSNSREKCGEYLEKMKRKVDKIIEEEGNFKLNKQVYGILGYKKASSCRH